MWTPSIDQYLIEIQNLLCSVVKQLLSYVKLPQKGGSLKKGMWPDALVPVSDYRGRWCPGGGIPVRPGCECT